MILTASGILATPTRRTGRDSLSVASRREPGLVWCEEFESAARSGFDPEADARASAQAQAAGFLDGYCNLEDRDVEFLVRSGNLREDVRCGSCGASNRQRQIVCALSAWFLGRPGAPLGDVAGHLNLRGLRVYLAESRSALADALRSALAPGLFACSEYFGPGLGAGSDVEGVRHEDLMELGFASASLDVVLTADVLEHVPDAPRAEQEIVRVLAPGGIHCFTVPFVPEGVRDRVLAEPDGAGRTVHHEPPQYHDDPLRPDGALVYRIFAQHDLRRRYESLGCTFQVRRFWSRSHGILGDNAFVLVASREGAARADASSASTIVRAASATSR